MWYKVRRLDGVEQDILIPPQAAARRCLDEVCEKLQLVERDLFGLRYRGEHGERLWLNLNNPVRDQLGHAAQPSYQLDFRVKYFAAPQDIQRPETRRQFYLELKKQLLYGSFVRCEQLAKLMGLIAQVEWGGYDDAADGGGGRQAPHYSSLVPWWPAHMIGAASEYHLLLRGASAEACISQFLEEVSGLEEYGTEYFDCESKQHDDLKLAVSKHGIVVIAFNRNILGRYPASDICDVKFNDKCFRLELNNATHVFHFTTVTEARAVTSSLIEQLVFFRMGNLNFEAMRLEQGGADDNHGTGVRLAADAAAAAAADGMDSGAVSGGTGRATHSQAEVEESDSEVDVTETEQYAQETPSSSVLSAERMCKICMSNHLCTVFCPCGHSVCCQSCANNFQHCPICRAQVVRVQTVYFS